MSRTWNVTHMEASLPTHELITPETHAVVLFGEDFFFQICAKKNVVF